MSDSPRSRHFAVERLHAMFADACFGRDAADVFDADLRGYLARHGVEPDDAAAILAAPRRLGLYRQLVRHNVADIIATMLERTRARMEARVFASFDRSVDDFLHESGPKTSHLRDVPREFLSWVSARWRADDRLPAWLVDYAELELADFTIGVAPRPLPPPPLADVAADLPLVFGDPTMLIRLGWAVHALAADDVAAEPEAREVALLVYRDERHQTRYVELTALAAAILERLLVRTPLARAMVDACTAIGYPLDESVLQGAATLLADLGERGVLLGAASSVSDE